MLKVDTTLLTEVPEDVITDIMNNNKPRFKSININNIPISSIINPKTDPAVRQFIQYITKKENNE